MVQTIEERLKKNREYMKEYCQRPEVIAYLQRPEVKARLKNKSKEYYKRPEVIARRKKYYNTKESKAKKEAYRELPHIKIKQKAYMKEYQKTPKARDSQKEYRNRPEVKISKMEYERTPENRRKNDDCKRRRRKTCSKLIFTERLRNRLWNALKIYTTTGKIYSSRTYGVDYKAIIEHLKPFPEERHLYHIDHIKPLCSFNLNDPEQIKIAFAPDNHQWLLSKDNLSKGKKQFIQLKLS